MSKQHKSTMFVSGSCNGNGSHFSYFVRKGGLVISGWNLQLSFTSFVGQPCHSTNQPCSVASASTDLRNLFVGREVVVKQ